jgi:hypothetical protein
VSLVPDLFYNSNAMALYANKLNIKEIELRRLIFKDKEVMNNYYVTDSIINNNYTFAPQFLSKKGIYFFVCKVKINYMIFSYLSIEDKKKAQYCSLYTIDSCAIISDNRPFSFILARKTCLNKDSSLIVPYKIEILKQYGDMSYKYKCVCPHKDTIR